MTIKNDTEWSLLGSITLVVRLFSLQLVMAPPFLLRGFGAFGAFRLTQLEKY